MSSWRPSARGSMPRSGAPGPLGAAKPAKREPKVKGVAFRSVLAILEQLRGGPFVEGMLQKLPADQAELLRYTVVQTGWYPISLYRALWSAILRESPGDYSIAREIGAGAIRRDVNGVYRVLFKVLSIETLLTLSNKLFPYYYDTGSIKNAQVATGLIRSVYEGCSGFDRAMWEELAGSCEALIQMAGGQTVCVTITRGGHDRSDSCVMNVEWR